MNDRKKLLVSLILCTSCLLTFTACHNNTASDLETFEPVTLGSLKTEKAVRGTITETLPITATISYDKYEVVSLTRVGAPILKVNFNEGQDVKKGDVIAEFDTSDCEFALTEAKLIYEKKKNQYESVLNNEKSTDLEKENARLSLEMGKIDVEKAQKDLDSLHITAPMDGSLVYTPQGIEPGTQLPPDFQIGVIVDRSSKILVTRSTFSPDIKLGMKVIDSDNNEGRIIGLPPPTKDSKNNSSYNEPKITISFPKEILDKVQSSISLKICLKDSPDVIKIPIKGVRTFDENNYVKIKDGDNKIERFVTLGVVTDTEAEVISGVNEGDEIILDN